MKKWIAITLVFNLTCFSYALVPEKDGETRTATFSRNVKPDDVINIQAKYTDLVIEAWHKNEVEVTATVRFDGKLTNKMVEFLDNFQKHVEDNIDKSMGELRINTNLDKPNKIQIGSKHVGVTVGFTDDELKLDFVIRAPKVNKYEINHSYRDILLKGDFDDMKITQYSGELHADYIDNVHFNMKYGSATLKEIGTAKMEIYEQEISVAIVDELEIDAKYAEVDIEEIQKMEMQSYESDFTFNNVNFISGSFKYGEIEIKDRLGNAEFECYEMDIESNSIENIKFENSKYSKIKSDNIETITYAESYEDETSIGNLGTFKSLNSKYGKHKIESLNGSLEMHAYEDDIDIETVSTSVENIFITGKYIDSSLGLSNESFSLKTNIKYGKVDFDESDMEVKKYIKDGDRLELEIQSKNQVSSVIQITIEGYEVDVNIN
ncbi:MAG: hypothetical protein AAGC64_13330 [Bacteroidota bacterium]